eukprot:6212287-Amphidinium_carterae.1
MYSLNDETQHDDGVNPSPRVCKHAIFKGKQLQQQFDCEDHPKEPLLATDCTKPIMIDLKGCLLTSSSVVLCVVLH